jgi:hypothetical protein
VRKRLDQDIFKTGFTAADYVQGQGLNRFKNGAYTIVREYFETIRNAGIEH